MPSWLLYRATKRNRHEVRKLRPGRGCLPCLVHCLEHATTRTWRLPELVKSLATTVNAGALPYTQGEQGMPSLPAQGFCTTRKTLGCRSTEKTDYSHIPGTKKLLIFLFTGNPTSLSCSPWRLPTLGSYILSMSHAAFSTSI